MAKSKKSNSLDVASPSKMKPSLHLDGEHAKALGRAHVGDTVQFHGHGKITSMSQHEYDGEKPSRHVTLEVHKLKHKKKAAPGRVGGKDADAADGAKAEMDEALADEE